MPLHFGGIHNIELRIPGANSKQRQRIGRRMLEAAQQIVDDPEAIRKPSGTWRRSPLKVLKELIHPLPAERDSRRFYGWVHPSGDSLHFAVYDSDHGRIKSRLDAFQIHEVPQRYGEFGYDYQVPRDTLHIFNLLQPVRTPQDLQDARESLRSQYDQALSGNEAND